MIEGQPGDPALVEWDAQIGGRRRPEDHAYWVEATRARPLWFRRGGAVVGYGYAQTYNPEALWHPDAITLGPIGAHSPEDAPACTRAAARWAQPRADAVRITVPGPHPRARRPARRRLSDHLRRDFCLVEPGAIRRYALLYPIGEHTVLTCWIRARCAEVAVMGPGGPPPPTSISYVLRIVYCDCIAIEYTIPIYCRAV